MFSLRIAELALPGGDRSRSDLLDWLASSLCLVRRRSDDATGQVAASPLLRLLDDTFLSQPLQGHEALDLADRLAVSPATLHHHLGRLAQARLISSHTHRGEGSRIYFLRTGSLTGAIDLMLGESRTVLGLRLEEGREWMDDISGKHRIEQPDDLPLRIWIQERVPAARSARHGAHTAWLADLGLLGDRPGRSLDDESLAIRLWEHMLAQDGPSSLDELAQSFPKENRSRLQRMLENHRAAGFLQRVPRHDRLAHALWNMMQTQHLRRGDEWLLSRGGLVRQLGEKRAGSLTSRLSKGSLTAEHVSKELGEVPVEDLMLLLNLLGGRLPFGYQWSAESYSGVISIVTDRCERALRRIRRVAELLEATAG